MSLSLLESGHFKNESLVSHKRIPWISMIPSCPVGLPGEIEGLVFMEHDVHWRWCGDDVYHTGRVHLCIMTSSFYSGNFYFLTKLQLC